jgi:hypothetical protein
MKESKILYNLTARFGASSNSGGPRPTLKDQTVSKEPDYSA